MYFPKFKRDLRSTGPALFIGVLNCRRREEKKRPQNGRKSREIRGPSLAHTSFPSPPSYTWRLPVYFRRGLFNSNRRSARSVKCILAKKKGDNNRPLSLLPPSFLSIAPLIKPNVLVIWHHERIDRRASIKRKKDKPDEKSDFRGIPKLTNARIRVEIYGRILDWTVGVTTAELNQFNINFVLLSQLHREHFSVQCNSIQRCSKQNSTSTPPSRRSNSFALSFSFINFTL